MRVRVTVILEASGGASFLKSETRRDVEAGYELEVFGEATRAFANQMADHAELHPAEHQDILANAPVPEWLT